MDGRWGITGRARTGSDREAGLSPLQESFVEAMARWASGTVVVAVRTDPSIAVITATSFASVSLEPPLILVCVGRDATVAPLLDEGERFAVSILAEEQRRLASMFADRGPLARDHFPTEGDPIVAEALAGLGCTVVGNHPGGDHRIVVGQVDHVVLGGERGPLVYYGRGYRKVR